MRRKKTLILQWVSFLRNVNATVMIDYSVSVKSSNTFNWHLKWMRVLVCLEFATLQLSIIYDPWQLPDSCSREEAKSLSTKSTASLTCIFSNGFMGAGFCTNKAIVKAVRNCLTSSMSNKLTLHAYVISQMCCWSLYFIALPIIDKDLTLS